MLSAWLFGLGLIMLIIWITHYGILEVMAILGFASFIGLLYDKLSE